MNRYRVEIQTEKENRQPNEYCFNDTQVGPRFKTAREAKVLADKLIEEEKERIAKGQPTKGFSCIRIICRVAPWDEYTEYAWCPEYGVYTDAIV